MSRASSTICAREVRFRSVISMLMIPARRLRVCIAQTALSGVLARATGSQDLLESARYAPINTAPPLPGCDHCLVILSAADSAMGQQFGRSQVRHRTFEFRVLRTEHFAIYYYAEATDAVQMAGRMAER
jgi:hypothetical protein